MKKLAVLLLLFSAAIARGQAVRADGGVVTGVTGAVGTSRTITTTSPLSGGGDLSANRTFSLGIVPAALGGFSVDMSAQTGFTHWASGTPTTAELAAANIYTIAETLLASTGSVNMNSATATTLYTCPTGKSCIITRVVVRNASTSLTTASYSFGWTSTAFNDVIANATHTELNGATVYTALSPQVGAKVGTSTGTFKVLMNTLQGTAATTTMDVFGYTF